ncbi:MAG: glycosyltransferase [Oscillospiraceae bacterium]|nr:glycosyltransferase [Oscillospiraceae bacterium]
MPEITVLLAVYRPNPAYFTELLKSLAAQTFQDFNVLVCDDSADTAESEQIRQTLSKELVNTPYQTMINAENLGSNKTFERLMSEADGNWFATCDQDDIWEPDKLQTLHQAVRQSGADMVYSDFSVIDGADRTLYDSFSQIRRRFCHFTGEELTKLLMISNCVTGCTVLMKARAAKSALPFPAEFVHDRWLALAAVAGNGVQYVNKPLVRYRLHSGNQIGFATLGGVDNKPDYIKSLEEKRRGLKLIMKRFSFNHHVVLVARETDSELERRLSLLRRPSLLKAARALRLKNTGKVRALFEILLAFSPKWICKRMISFSKKH